MSLRDGPGDIQDSRQPNKLAASIQEVWPWGFGEREQKVRGGPGNGQRFGRIRGRIGQLGCNALLRLPPPAVILAG